MGVTLWKSHFTGDVFDAVTVDVVSRVSLNLIPNKGQHRRESEFAVREMEDVSASAAFYYIGILMRSKQNPILNLKRQKKHMQSPMLHRIIFSVHWIAGDKAISALTH